MANMLENGVKTLHNMISIENVLTATFEITAAPTASTLPMKSRRDGVQIHCCGASKINARRTKLEGDNSTASDN
jgi:hypothetical protein